MSAALGLHALALQGLQPPPPGQAAALATPTSLRWVQLPAPSLSLVQAQAPHPAHPGATPAAPAPTPPMLSAPRSPAALPAPADRPAAGAPPGMATDAGRVPEAATAPDPSAASENRLAADADADDGPAAAADTRREIAARPVPRYAARLPAPFQLRWALERGEIRGHGELRFEHDAPSGRYRLQLLLQGPQRPMWEQTSTGVATGQGLQPEQFNDRRRGRRIGTADFDRASAQVRFSGKAPPLPIAEAAQDRLSWMVQLPAALAADAGLRRPGSTVWLQVFSARGDVQLWAFEVQGLQPVALGDGSAVEALHVRRLPERLYDTQIDAWLDPAGQFLPVRLWLTHWPSGERMTLTRQGP